MSDGSFLLTEEKLLCCICLDVFRDPVTLQCGHNFCKSCITEHLNFNSQRQCPMCKEHIDKRCKLGVNTFISEMALQFRQAAGRKLERHEEEEEETLKPPEVPRRLPKPGATLALNSWLLLAFALTLVTVYSAANLKLHWLVSGPNVLQLFGSVEEAASGVCAEHYKPLELFCRNEQVSICRSCADSAHRSHQVVSLQEEYEAKAAALRRAEAELQAATQERRRRIRQVVQSVKLSREAADREVAEGVRVFDALTEAVERAKAELVAKVEEKKKAKEQQAVALVKELEQEIAELTRRRAEVERLSSSEDHLRLLWSSPSLTDPPPPSEGWTETSVCPASYEGITRTTLVDAVNRLTETVRQETKKLQEAERRKRQQEAVDVTLDPDTAHPALVLSDDGKRVHHGDAWKKLPDSAKRFEPAINVLGKQSFSCGRFYYDVQVRGNVGWTLGVAKRSVSRKGDVVLNPENGFWTICRRNRRGYLALDDPPVPLSVNDHPATVRVFVDYEEGSVSFYDVDTSDLLFSFTGCSFTEKLHPFFSPGTSDGGRNSAPLVIAPVDQSVL